MLNSLGKKIESLNDKMNNINNKIKDTVEQAGRGSGKLFVDIGCIVRKGRQYGWGEERLTGPTGEDPQEFWKQYYGVVWRRDVT